MDEHLTEEYIPQNISNTGDILGGRTTLRNGIEALILLSLAIVIAVILSLVIPGDICLAIGVILSGAALLLGFKGVGGEPVSIWIMNIINYSKTRCYVTIRMPLPAELKEKEELEEEARNPEDDLSPAMIFIEKLKNRGKKNAEK